MLRIVPGLIGILLATGAVCGLADAPATRPNVLLICVDDLRPELNCYGADYIHSPNIDALASRGTKFENHFVNAPTCGASRYTLLTGRYGGGSNQTIFDRAQRIRNGENVSPSLPRLFREAGYTTVSVGKVSHHPGGRGGDDWDDPDLPEMPGDWDRHLLPAGQWKHPRGWMHGLAHGKIRDPDAKAIAVYESAPGSDEIYPDGPSVNLAIEELQTLASEENPFFLAVGILRPHLPFGAPAKYLDRYRDIELSPIPHPKKPDGKTTWHGSGEIKVYDFLGHSFGDPELNDQLRRHYAACVTYADVSVGRVIEALQKSGQADNTIIVLWGDHGWHLGEHGVWGKHTLFEESLHSPLIIVRPGEKDTHQSVSGLVSTLDIYPTLCDMAGLKKPDELIGQSLTSFLDHPNSDGHNVFATFRGDLKTIRTDRYRLIQHPNDFFELYDRQSDPDETINIAKDQPKIVQQLRGMIDREMSR